MFKNRKNKIYTEINKRTYFNYLLKILFCILLLNLFFISSFSISLNITGKIDSYSKSYYEKVNIKLNCGEKIKIKLPNNAYKINYTISNFNFFDYDNKIISIKDCSKINQITYYIDNVEYKNKNKIRFERNFNNYNRINYSYSLFIPLEYNLDENLSIPKPNKIKYHKNYKELIFKPNNLYLLYFNNVENEEGITTNHIIDELEEKVVILLIVISFLLGVFLSYIYFSKKINNFPKTKVPSYLLNQEELEIIKIIKNNPGINQKQIAKELNLSKSKISAIINELENKKLIKREKFGRSFKVYLDKEVI